VAAKGRRLNRVLLLEEKGKRNRATSILVPVVGGAKQMLVAAGVLHLLHLLFLPAMRRDIRKVEGGQGVQAAVGEAERTLVATRVLRWI